MEDNASTNPWISLSTVTTFDRGNSVRSTVCLEGSSDQTAGHIVSIVAPSNSLLIESLIRQLCAFFESDVVRRKKLYFAICERLHELKLIDNTYNMIEFETLRGEYQQALYQLVTIARAATGCDSAIQVPSTLVTEWSRYHKEFQEISFIAAGGFGHVFKALHRLDGIEYAIKKIVVRSGRVRSIMQHLEEVKTLAKLNHTNIVSYKGAWIEPTLPVTFMPSLPSTSHAENKLTSSNNRDNIHRDNVQSQSSSSSCWNNQSLERKDEQKIALQNRTSSSYEQKIGEKNITNKNTDKNNSNSVSFRTDNIYQDNKIGNITKYTDSSDSCEESNSIKKVCPYIPQMNKQYVTLYIQMTLCEKTLQQWLDERMDVTPQAMIITILTQILHGLDYIHSRGIVHHDIKPSNIFISMSDCLQIQLGDFGLACPLQRETHHSILGTHMYAAPEQLEGKCDPKSDVYSLGIVLLELLVHTKTQMERIKVINGVRNGQIPTTLTAMYPKWAHIVSQLVQKDPKKRPSTNELLQTLNEDKDVTIAELKNNIAEKDNAIQKLQKRILMLEAQITKHNISLENT